LSHSEQLRGRFLRVLLGSGSISRGLVCPSRPRLPARPCACGVLLWHQGCSCLAGRAPAPAVGCATLSGAAPEVTGTRPSLVLWKGTSARWA